MAKYRENTSVSFINPYNFVRVLDEPQRYHANENEKPSSTKGRTGYIECTITVKTPLAIPDTQRREGSAGHYTYPFMRINGNYVIPGSSIRGELRNIYEIVTDSCMGSLKEGTTISTRISNLEAFQPGLLKYEKKQWKLYSATRYAIISGSKGYKYFSISDDEKFEIRNSGRERRIVVSETEQYSYGERVFFEEGNNQKRKAGETVWEKNVKCISKERQGKCVKEGYVYIGETFAPKKHAESIFVEDEQQTGERFSEGEIKKALYGLCESLKVYQDKAVNRSFEKGHSGYKGFEKKICEIKEKDHGVLPIWYRKEGKYLYFSLAAIGRKQYRNTINEMKGSRCQGRDELCKACSLFGMIASNKENEKKDNKSKGSRIRITDAVCVEGNVTNSPVTLKELGKPRPSYLPFYAIDGKTYDSPEGNIRGRKFYWHIPEASADHRIYSTSKKNERNASHYLMMPGAKFVFRLYYDGISEEELKKLLWCVTLGDQDGTMQRYHHLGHGKPLGLGSVEITIDNNIERIWENGNFQLTQPVPQYKEAVDETKHAVADLIKICTFTAVKGETVCYPYVEIGDDRGINELIEDKKRNSVGLKENVLANHQWFTQYRGTSRKDKKRTMPEIEQISTKSTGYRLSGYQISELDPERDFERPRDMGARKPGKYNNKNNYQRKHKTDTRR